MSEAEKTDEAYGKSLGAAAFARGVMCAPAMDDALRSGSMNANIFKGWQRGWISASLAA